MQALFTRLLDEQHVDPGDAVFILRNWEEDENDIRALYGTRLLQKELAPLMFMSFDLNTREEAIRALRIAHKLSWTSILLVTSPYHKYRSFLTFLKVMRDNKMVVSLISAPVSMPMDTERLVQELDKITYYQEKGDIASYADGVSYLAYMHARRKSERYADIG